MQNRFGLLDTDVMPMFMIIALDIIITMRFSINCSEIICSPTVIFAILREATSETYGPGLLSIILSLFYIIYFQIYKPKNPRIPCCNLLVFTLFYDLVIFYIHLYQISLLQVIVKGLTTPLSRWVQVV